MNDSNGPSRADIEIAFGLALGLPVGLLIGWTAHSVSIGTIAVFTSIVLCMLGAKLFYSK